MKYKNKNKIFQKNKIEYFVKEYIGINKELIEKEYEKTKIIYHLSKKTKFFSFPKPVNYEENKIVIEKINRFKELRTYIFENNNIFFQDVEKIKKIMIKTGKALSFIHKNLLLKKKEKLDWKIKEKECFLYGDFGISNILVKKEKIYLIDPSFNSIQNKVFLYGTIYYDLSFFIFQLTYLYPLKNYFFIKKQNTKLFVEEFVKAYEKESREKISKELLNKSLEKIKKEYLENLGNSLRESIWKKIIK
jgi:hypothetical protein